jgi:hypothetical protein
MSTSDGQQPGLASAWSFFAATKNDFDNSL